MGNDGNDTIYSNKGVNTIYGGRGNDRIYGDIYEDIIFGGEGDDYIEAGFHNQNMYPNKNEITGGTGNDTIIGGNGADIYYFNLGDGHDNIKEYAINAVNFENDSDYSKTFLDTIVFGEGINPEDLIITNNGWDLVINFVNNTEDSITIKEWFRNSTNYSGASQYKKIEHFKFADGTIIHGAEVERNIVVHGTEGNDSIGTGSVYTDETVYGYSGDDYIYAGQGNDTIYAGDGNDIINDYSGNNFIFGENGNDQIYAGEGSDTISGGEGNDYIEGGWESLTNNIDGGAGNDKIYTSKVRTWDPIQDASSAYKQIVRGGTGDDLIFGAKHGDDYHFKLGDGNDYIIEYDFYDISDSFKDRIIFEDVYATDVRYEKMGNSLIIQLNNEIDSIIVREWFNTGTEQKIEELVFADGEIITSSDIDAMSLPEINEIINIYNISENTGNLIIESGLYDNNKFIFDESISILDIKRSQTQNDLILYYKGTSNSIVLKNWQQGEEYQNSTFEFNDGTIISTNDIFQLPYMEVIIGTDNDDYLMGMPMGEAIYIGGLGDDYIETMDSSDTYVINNGDGNDTINDFGMMDPMQKDIIQFTEAQYDSLWLAVNGNQELEITNLETQEATTVQNWIQEEPIEEIQASGLDIDNQQINQLIQAMSGFNPPTSSLSEIGTTNEQTLRDAINLAWNPS